MSAKEKHGKLTQEQRRLYGRVMAMTKPYWGRLTLAVVFGLMFGGSLFGLLAAGKSGLSQAFGGKVTALQESAKR